MSNDPTSDTTIGLSLLDDDLREAVIWLQQVIVRDDKFGRSDQGMRYPIDYMNELSDAQREQVVRFMEATPLHESTTTKVGPSRRKLTPAQRKLCWNDVKQSFVVSTAVPQF